MRVTAASLAVWALIGATSAIAAPPRPVGVDHASSFLIDPATSEKLWRDNTPARVLQLYPAGRFRFVSEVGGGFTEARLCVVSARAMLLPVRGGALVYAPVKAATAFDAAPELSREQCRDLARSKLVDAIQSVVAALAG
jgi:hypothetical protein